MAGAYEDQRTRLHRVASSNLPIVSRKSWQYYVAILQPGFPLEKCEHGDFLWMKVNRTVTIDKILKLHFERTGRNSILLDGEFGLTIDTRVRDIPCLGLGVYAFWEIVKVERWWEYKVRPTNIYESLGAMKEAEPARSIGKRSGPILTTGQPSLMVKDGYREKQRWSWEATVPSTNLHAASIESRSRGVHFKDSLTPMSKFMTGEEEPIESSASKVIPRIQTNEEIRANRLRVSNDLGNYLMQEHAPQVMKRWSEYL